MNDNNLDPELKFKNILHAFEIDADGLGMLCEFQSLNTLLSVFNDYEKFIKERKSSTTQFIKKVSKGTNIIHANTNNSKLKEIFYYAHLSACCELFDGWEFPIEKMSRAGINQYVKETILANKNSSHDIHQALETRVHNSDAVRTIQILRLLGLVTMPSNLIQQLSFAAGSGSRDTRGIHVFPKITSKSPLFRPDNDISHIKFEASIQQANHVILIDNDTQYSSLYKNINECTNTLAYNEDADKAIPKIKDHITNNTIAPINSVIGLRIDHRMVPDVDVFFKQLFPLLDNTADFIFTVGKGHTLEEFQGRKKIMAEIFQYLRKAGMKPVRLLLHGGKTLEEQRDSPCFALSPFTTYDIIYCKLVRNNLS